MKIRLYNKKRGAVSELVGTLLMVALTLIAGAAVFSWINGQASSSEAAYGASVANNVNFLRERFSIVSMNFSNGGLAAPCTATCSSLSVYLYNNGQLVDNISRISISAPPGSSSTFLPISFGPTSTTVGGCTVNPILPNQKSASGLMKIQTLQKYTVNIPNCFGTSTPMTEGQSYLVTVYGLYGNSVAMTVQAIG